MRRACELLREGIYSPDQIALWHYMVEYFTKCYSDLAKEKLGTDMLDTQLAYSIRFYCMGSVGMTQEWVLTDNITSAETIVQMMFASMPDSLHQIYFGRCEEITAI